MRLTTFEFRVRWFNTQVINFSIGAWEGKVVSLVFYRVLVQVIAEFLDLASQIRFYSHPFLVLPELPLIVKIDIRLEVGVVLVLFNVSWSPYAGFRVPNTVVSILRLRINKLEQLFQLKIII